MTLAEIERLLNSRKRTEQRENQKKAYFDYMLADLIGCSIARLYSSSNEMPSLQEAYSGIFDTKETEEQKQIKQNKTNEIRFLQFANTFNKKSKEAKKQ